MSEKAARVTDTMVCPAADKKPPVEEKGCCEDKMVPQPPQPHVGGPLSPTGSPNVKVNNLAAMRTGDSGMCVPVAALDTIVTGAATVKINGRLGARVTSVLAHDTGSKVTTGSPNVKYGGPTAGATFGDARAAAAAKKACEDAAKGGRGGAGKPQGKNMNCGMESVRQLCLQKCNEKKLPADDPACKCGNQTQDEWYKHYLEKYKDDHNKIAEVDYEKKLKEYNDAVAYNDEQWKIVRQHKGFRDHSTEKGSQDTAYDPAKHEWTFAEGQNVYCFNNKPRAEKFVYIKRVPPKPMPPVTNPDEQAKQGDVGSFTATRTEMLKECGYKDPQTGTNSESGIGSSLADGNLVLAVVDVGKMPGGGASGAHTVTVTRMEYDDKGNLTKVTVNDTSRPDSCGKDLTGSEFQAALLPESGATNVVPAPVAPP